MARSSPVAFPTELHLQTTTEWRTSCTRHRPSTSWTENRHIPNASYIRNTCVEPACMQVLTWLTSACIDRAKAARGRCQGTSMWARLPLKQKGRTPTPEDKCSAPPSLEHLINRLPLTVARARRKSRIPIPLRRPACPELSLPLRASLYRRATALLIRRQKQETGNPASLRHGHGIMLIKTHGALQS